MRTTRLSLAAAALVAVCSSGSLAAPGDLDPTFNGGALKVLELSKKSPGSTSITAVQVDAAGRIVLAGNALDEDGRTGVVVARLAADGALDATFGEGGSRVIQGGRGGGTIFSLTEALSPRPNGAGWIVTGGASATDGRQAVLVLAVDDGGAVDLGFGAGGSIRAQPAGPPPEFTLAGGGGGGGAIDADGSVVVAHTVALDPSSSLNRKLAVVKLTAQGQPDNGFANMGVYTNRFSQTPADLATDGIVALPGPNGVVVGGYTLDATGHSAFLVLRLTSGGILDPGFAAGAGYRVLQASDPAAASGFAQVRALALGPDGAIFAAGIATDGTGHSALAVARFTADGLLDLSFGSSGIARIQTASADPGVTTFGAAAEAVVIQPDGRILLVGSSGGLGFLEMVVVRLTTSGDLDDSFGAGGVVRLQPSTAAVPDTRVHAGAIAPDGNTLLVGGEISDSGRGFVGRILLASSTTTTTLPGCTATASLEAVLCRLGDLRSSVDAIAPPGQLRDRLVSLLERSTALTTAGTSLTGGRRKKTLKKALAPLARFRKQLRSKKARRTLQADVIGSFTDEASRIAETLTTVRAGSS